MANSKLFLVALLGALLCAGATRQVPGGTDDSKIDIGIGLAPPNTGVIGINDTININTPGLAPPPGNLVSIGTNNTVKVPLPTVPLSPVAGILVANAKAADNAEGSSTAAATDESKIDIGIGLAPPNTGVVGINDTININTPGLAPPPGNLVSIGTNNTVKVPLPTVPLPPVAGILVANAKAADNAEGSSTAAATDESKIDIGIGLAPPNTGVVGINDTININTPGLAPPPGNLVSIGTNNTIEVPLLPVPPVGLVPIAIP